MRYPDYYIYRVLVYSLCCTLPVSLYCNLILLVYKFGLQQERTTDKAKISALEARIAMFEELQQSLHVPPTPRPDELILANLLAKNKVREQSFLSLHE
jgi:hypothetical protein